MLLVSALFSQSPLMTRELKHDNDLRTNYGPIPQLTPTLPPVYTTVSFTSFQTGAESGPV